MAKKGSHHIDTLIWFVKTNNRDGLSLCVILRMIRDESPKDLQKALALLRGDPRYQVHAKRFGRKSY